MFVLSLRMSKRQLLSIVLCLAVLGLLLIGVLSWQPGSGDDVTGTDADPDAVCISFLEARGWLTEPKPPETGAVLIPDEFDAVYERYNAMQQKQGLDLWPYHGQVVERRVYAVRNHPSGEDVQATLLLFENRVIAGDLACTKLDGFMHGFELPEDGGYNAY